MPSGLILSGEKTESKGKYIFLGGGRTGISKCLFKKAAPILIPRPHKRIIGGSNSISPDQSWIF